MKKLKVFLSLFITLLLLFVSFVSVDVIASENKAYLITTNPAENSNIAMNISWHCDVDTEKYVEYTVATDTEFTNSKKQVGVPELETIYNSSVGGNSTSYRFRAQLYGLTEDTQYIYRIVGKTKSEVHTFKTGGASKYTAYVVSDVHTYAKLSNRLSTAEKIYSHVKEANKPMQLVLATGDMTAYGTSRDDWKALLNSNFATENVYAASPGNHDYYNTSANFLDSSYFNSNFYNPQNGAESSMNTSYFFYYGNVLYISLNSEDACTNTSAMTSQVKWLEEVLEKNTAQFIVVYFHRSMYPGSGGNTGHASKMKNGFQKLFDKYGVDLVFGGHDHVYVRTNRIYQGTTTTIPGVGTTYVSLTQVGDRKNTANSDMTDIAFKSGSNIGAIGLTVDSEWGTMFVRFYNEKFEMVDSAGINAKTRQFDCEKYMKTSCKFSYDSGFSSLKLDYGKELFQKATKVSVIEDGKVIKSVRPEYENTIIDSLGANDIDKQKTYTVKVDLRDGTSYEKEYVIKNKLMDYGTISGLKYKDGKIEWDADLENDIITEYKLTVNSNTYKIPNTNNSFEMYLREYEENSITLQAINKDDIVLYEESIVYGENINIVHTYEENIQLEVNEEKEITVTNNYSDNFSYSIISDDENIVVDGMKVKALKEGSYQLTVKVADNGDEFTINLEVVAPVKQASGCNAVTILFESLLLLGLVILRKKH